jgi:hypothetical protein
MTTRLWFSLILVMIDLALLEHGADGQSPSPSEAVLKATLTADMQGITVHRRSLPNRRDPIHDPAFILSLHRMVRDSSPNFVPTITLIRQGFSGASLD